MLQSEISKLPSSAARERIGAVEFKRLSLALSQAIPVGRASACLVLNFGVERKSRQAEACPTIIPGCENGWNLQRCGCCSR